MMFKFSAHGTKQVQTSNLFWGDLFWDIAPDSSAYFKHHEKLKNVKFEGTSNVVSILVAILIKKTLKFNHLNFYALSKSLKNTMHLLKIRKILIYEKEKYFFFVSTLFCISKSKDRNNSGYVYKAATTKTVWIRLHRLENKKGW